MVQDNVKFITLWVMCLTLFMTSLGDTVMNIALPSIQTSLAANVSGLQWILNAYNLPTVSLALTSGGLENIYGRKRIFLAGLVIFTIASLLCGLASNPEILIAGRILQGIGAAAVLTGSLSILTDTFPNPKEKAKAIGIWSGISGIALVAGPVVGGLAVDTLGWQSIFFLNLPFGAIGFVLTDRVVKEVITPGKRNLDVPGLLLSIVFLATLTYALTESNTGVGQSSLIIWLLGIAGLSLTAFLIVESQSSQPMLPLSLFINPTFTAVNVVSILVSFTFISLVFSLSLFLQQVQGYSAVQAGIGFLPMNGAFVLACIVSGWFIARLGWRFTISMGLIAAGVTSLSFIRASADIEYAAIVWPLVVAGFGGGLGLAPLAAAAMTAAPPSKAGIASAIVNTSSNLGNLLGIALQGTILAHWLALDLARSLSAWNLPSNLQERLIAYALHGGTKVPRDLPASISASVWHQVFSQAFVSGLHAVILIASVALLVGALLILAFVPPSFKTKSDLGKAAMSRDRPKE